VAKHTYFDLDLLIERAEERYRARVLDSPAGQAMAHFDLPITGQILAGRLVSDMESAQAFGADLFGAVFSGEVMSCLRRSMDEADRQGGGLRIRLRLGDVPELASMPWEYLYDAAREQFLALSTETPLIRYLDLPERVQSLSIERPLKILVMVSSPDDQPPLDTDREWAVLQEALSAIEEGGQVAVERLEGASLVDLQRQLRQDDYHVFHFVGHGGFDERTQDGVLILEDEQGQSHYVSGQELGTILHDQRSLRLAFLNACEGARASDQDPFAGVAQSLVQREIPAVVAMQVAVSDQAAISLVGEFYGALAEGYPVDAALSEARKAVFASGNDVEWGTPVIFMRAPDGRIFDLERTRAPSLQVNEGLSALVELMQSPEVRAAVVTFRTDFEAACQQIDVLGDYKDLHDLLHTMQFHCYHPIVQESRRFPDDDLALDNLTDYGLTLGGTVSSLQEVAGRTTLASFETAWVAELDQARQELDQALESLDVQPFKKSIWRMNRVLAIQPSQINTRLNEVARALRLPALVSALTAVRDQLRQLELDAVKMDQFNAGVDALDGLNQRLAELVASHDRWQVIDLELRRIETAIRQDTMELEMSWPSLRDMVAPQYEDQSEDWATSLDAAAHALDDALAQGSPAKTRRCFWRYRRQAGDRFYRVDVDLKNLCEELRDVGDPLTSVMTMIGQ
jgi:hypothetical protein